MPINVNTDNGWEPVLDIAVDGDSAYQVALNNGFVGDEDDWLASLVGPQGEQGIQGTIVAVSVSPPDDPEIGDLWVPIPI